MNSFISFSLECFWTFLAGIWLLYSLPSFARAYYKFVQVLIDTAFKMLEIVGKIGYSVLPLFVVITQIIGIYQTNIEIKECNALLKESQEKLLENMTFTIKKCDQLYEEILARKKLLEYFYLIRNKNACVIEMKNKSYDLIDRIKEHLCINLSLIIISSSLNKKKPDSDQIVLKLM